MFLKLAYHILTLYILSVSSLGNLNLQSLRSPHCDFWVLHCGLESPSFHPTVPLRPSLLVNLAAWAELGFDLLDLQQAISVVKMRPNAKCVITLIHCSPFVEETFTLQKFKFELVRYLKVPLLYYSSYGIRVYTEHGNMYTVLLTTLEGGFDIFVFLQKYGTPPKYWVFSTFSTQEPDILTAKSETFDYSMENLVKQTFLKFNTSVAFDLSRIDPAIFENYQIANIKAGPAFETLSDSTVIITSFNGFQFLTYASTFIRLVLGSWSLMSVVLTNCYNGLVISELNAPFETTKWETFKDVSCLERDVQNLNAATVVEHLVMEGDLNSNPSFSRNRHLTDIMSSYEKLRRSYHPRRRRDEPLNTDKVDKKCFAIYSPPITEARSVYIQFEFIRFLINEFDEITLSLKNNANLLPPFLVLLDLLHPKRRHKPEAITWRKKYNSTTLQELIEREVVKCEKSLFITRSDEILAELDFLTKNYPGIRVRKNPGFYSKNNYPGVLLGFTGFWGFTGFYWVLLYTGL
ncbi:hypothetical protein Fcan01_24990 [Folsomia candida]|uniref:Uncharacterized protein n=1 Tax=Folsomia candida TaxID=158441 RepID=A0A226D5H9_FOLCA|nr:hypothetical protein Fcan01_24990 [Folsomia candida]